jgi:hypothetical protein
VQLFPWIQRLLGHQPAPALPTITADATGFSLTHRRQSRAVPWQAVRKIAAFKQDQHSHDRIVLLIEVSLAGDQVITLPEDSPGFADLFGPMEQALGIDPSWYLEIMTPVFAATPRILYLRSAGTSGLSAGDD